MIFCHQRVAAGKDDFIQLRVRRDVVQCHLPVAFIALIFGVREVATEAIAAIYRATALNQQQGAITVFMQQTRYDTVLLFQRIGAVSGGGNKLILRGKRLF